MDHTRPIIGIENRTAQEVFDIMCDRLRSALAQEREECARVAERIGKFHIDNAKMCLPIEPSPIIARDRNEVAQRIASAIRSRGEQQNEG